MKALINHIRSSQNGEFYNGLIFAFPIGLTCFSAAVSIIYRHTIIEDAAAYTVISTLAFSGLLYAVRHAGTPGIVITTIFKGTYLGAAMGAIAAPILQYPPESMGAFILSFAVCGMIMFYVFTTIIDGFYVLSQPWRPDARKRLNIGMAAIAASLVLFSFVMLFFTI